MARKSNKNYYAVRMGRCPGIYTSWDACREQVDGYPRAAYKGFVTMAEAEAYMFNFPAGVPPPPPAAPYAEEPPLAPRRAAPRRARQFAPPGVAPPTRDGENLVTFTSESHLLDYLGFKDVKNRSRL